MNDDKDDVVTELICESGKDKLIPHYLCII